MTIEEILGLAPAEVVEKITAYKGNVPEWENLSKMLDVKQHEVHDTALYSDGVKDDGSIDKKVRVTYSFGKLVSNRATGWTVGIPPKRIYNNPTNDKKLAEAQALIESIYKSVKIKTIHRKRVKKYYRCCQVLTLWYLSEEKEEHLRYGRPTKYKVRCRLYSPEDNYTIHPIFDDSGDYVAVGISYEIVSGEDKIKTLDIYTSTAHYTYSDDGNGYTAPVIEYITTGKNPTIYTESDDCIYADSISKIEESEWAISRTGNYIKKQTQPRGVISDDEVIAYGDEKRDENSGEIGFTQVSSKGRIGYLTWEVSKESVEFYSNTLVDMSFEETQIPNISFKQMAKLELSGEAFERIFVDARLKVLDEAGAIEETNEREFSVLCSLAKVIAPDLKDAIDQLDCVHEIVPFTMKSKKEEIDILYTATGGKAIMSQLEGIASGGMSSDPQATMDQIAKENSESSFTQGN